MQRPGITRAQQAEALIMEDLLEGLIWAEKNGGLGLTNDKCCPVLRITYKTRQLMSCVTYTDGQAMPWCEGGSSAQPLWWLETMGAMSSAVSEHYSQKAKAAEDTSGR